MFAMVAFTVAQRTKEIGIRMAIGARALDVLRAVFSQNLAPVALGMAVGTALGIAVGKLFGSMVEARINTLDPLGFAMGLAAFSAIAVLATWSPAVKALRIDPSNTLRCE
jgi:ABC-type antimicrobial peptide transport system permease subunit